MIDWLTLRTERKHVDPSTIDELLSRVGRVTKTTNAGEIVWCIVPRESVRSDSHQVTVHLGSEKLELSGSPARVMESNNVFGSGNIVDCALAMIDHVAGECGVLPRVVEAWECGRIDVTHNYAMKDASEVRQGLMYLRHCEGGRYQVRTQSESVYWSPGSRSRSAKAYHKGPHLERQLRRGEAEAEGWQVDQAARLLRLELSLRSHWWGRQWRSWFDWTELEFDREHEKFFDQFIPKIMVADMDTSLLNVCERVASSVGYGRSAFRTWQLIQKVGSHQAQSLMNRRTWHHHKKILFAAGLTFADFAQAGQGNVVQLRREIVLREPVRSWDELRAA